MAHFVSTTGMFRSVAMGWPVHPSVATEPVSNLSIPKGPHFQSTFETSMPCGEVRRLFEGENPAPRRDLLGALAVTSLLGGASTLVFSQGPSQRFLAAAGDWTDGNALLLITGLSIVAVAGFLIVRAVRPSKPPTAESAPGPTEPSVAAPRPRKTERLRRTLPLPPEPQPCAPTQELALGLAPLSSLHGVETGPIAVAAPLPTAVSGPGDLTSKYESGAVQTAMPDDPTRSEGVPLPARSGDTERLVEGEAAPKIAWQGPGTEPIIVRRKTEPLIEAVPATLATPRKDEFAIEAPVWAPGDHLEFLRALRGPKWRGLVKPEILESAVRFLEQGGSGAGTGPSETAIVVAYLRLSRLGIAAPFDLERELGLLRQRPESSERIFETELGELRALLDVEPLETNRAVVRAVLKKAEGDIRWLHDPMNRVLHLLCRKRAGDLRPDVLRKYLFDIPSHWKLFCSPDSLRKVLF